MKAAFILYLIIGEVALFMAVTLGAKAFPRHRMQRPLITMIAATVFVLVWPLVLGFVLCRSRS